MKILVIDDTRKHLGTALTTLEGNEITLCSTHEEARKILSCKHEFEAVLCDLLMPASSYMQGSDEGKRLAGTEMAVGWSLALMAIKSGAKYVAVVTDTNHHNHPASAMLDDINRHVFEINGAKMLMTNQIEMVETGAEITCKICKGSGKKDGETCWWCKGKKKEPEEGKNWGKVLNRLIASNG